jgi:hypothetical protein
VNREVLDRVDLVKALSNDYSVVKIGFDTTENEPLES